MKAMFATVQHRFQGIHCWPGVPKEHPHSHLKNKHRHMFHVKLWIEQFHNDRDVEYLECRDWLEGICIGGDMDYKSCEMIASGIVDKATRKYGTDRRYRCSVLEDGENGAYLEI